MTISALKMANSIIGRQAERIAELEKERDEAGNRVEMCNLSDWRIYQETDFGKKMLAIRDLEQQAKGLREYSEYLISDAEGIPEGLEHKSRGSNIYNWQTHFARELRYRSNNLNNAKEELKEGK